MRTIIILLFLTMPAFSQMLQGVVGGVAPATATCSTPKDGTIDDGVDYAGSIAYDSGSIYMAASFTAGSSYTLCALDVKLSKTGSPTFNLRAAIYSDGTGPSALVGTASADVSASTVGSSIGTVSFTGLNASITSGSVYWVVIYYASGALNHYADYVGYRIRSGSGSQYSYKAATGPSSWTQLGQYNAANFKSYSQ